MFISGGGQSAFLTGQRAGKIQVWKPPTASALVGKLGAFLALSLQFSSQVYANPQQPFFDSPQSKGATPCVPRVVQVPPQQFDYTLPPFFDTAQIGTTPTGSVPTTSSSFGLHAVALYNAEAQKSQIWESVTAASPVATGIMRQIGPQSFDFTLQPFFDAPVNGSRPRIATTVTVNAQSIDLSVQPFLDAPVSAGGISRKLGQWTTASGTDRADIVFQAPQPLIDAPPIQGTTPAGCVPSTQSTFGTHAATLYNAEAQKVFFDAPMSSGGPSTKLGQWTTASGTHRADVLSQAPQPFFDAPQVSGNTPRVPTLLQAAPQSVDLTLPPFFDVPQAGLLALAKLGQWTSGSPQAFDFTVQPFVDVPQLNPAGWLVTFTAAASDPTEFLALQTTRAPFFDVLQASGATPRIIPTVWTPEQAYVNPAPQVSRSLLAAGGPALGTVIKAPQQAYNDAQPRLFAPLTGQPPIIGLVPLPVRAAPQSFDFTLQPFLDTPQVVGSLPRIASMVGMGPQSIDSAWQPFFEASAQSLLIGAVPPYLRATSQTVGLTQQTFFDAPVPAAQIGSVPSAVASSPQAYDFTLQPQFTRVSTALLRGPVPPLTQAAPQLADLNLQPRLSRPLIMGQGKLGAFTIAPPQQFDYTLPAEIMQPLVTRLIYVIRAPQRLELGDYGPRITLNGYPVRIPLDDYGKRIWGS